MDAEEGGALLACSVEYFLRLYIIYILYKVLHYMYVFIFYYLKGWREKERWSLYKQACYLFTLYT